MNNYEIQRKLNKTGKHFVYYPTINGKRITRTNWIRKYDARGLLKNVVAKYGEAKLYELTTEKGAK